MFDGTDDGAAIALAVCQLELFSTLSDDDRKRVAALVERIDNVADGQVICAEGSLADQWWIVLEGDADVTIGGYFVGSIGSGETIGELAALDDGRRSATVTARTAQRLAVIPTARFDELLDLVPSISRALLKQMSGRLRNATSIAARASGSAQAARARSIARDPKVVKQAAPSFDPAQFNPFTPEFFDNPYPSYAVLREHSPVVYNGLIDSWIVGRYADVARLYRDRSVSSDIDNATRTPFVEASRRSDAELGYPKTVSRFDGTDHMRLRRLVSSAFTPKAMQRIRGDIATIASKLLDDAAPLGEDFDFVEHVALPLPSRVISKMLGVPEDDIEMLHELSLVASLLPEPMVSPEQSVQMKAAIGNLRAYVLDLAHYKRTHPGDDVLTALVQARENDDRLSNEELVDNAGLLYIAGHITTVNLLSSMVSLLAQNPDQTALLIRDPGLHANAVEEVLRIEPPTQFGRRFATADVSLDDAETIPSGSSIILAIGSANRDPRHWGDDADEFRVDRIGSHQHLSFAAGGHFCVGAALARTEAQVVLELLLQRYPNFVVSTEERNWGERLVLRGLEHLPVRLAPI